MRVGDADQLLHGSTVPTSLLASMAETSVVRSRPRVELLFERVKVEVSLTVHGNVHDFEAEPFVSHCADCATAGARWMR